MEVKRELKRTSSGSDEVQVIVSLLSAPTEHGGSRAEVECDNGDVDALIHASLLLDILLYKRKRRTTTG